VKDPDRNLRFAAHAIAYLAVFHLGFAIGRHGGSDSTRDQGRLAHEAGLSANANPYANQYDAAAWLGGWAQARVEENTRINAEANERFDRTKANPAEYTIDGGRRVFLPHEVKEIP
jgi:ribosome modulation factor